MANLLSAVNAEFGTDFAMLQASQPGDEPAEAGGFVGSIPGSISGRCGTKYPRVLIRAERWDARPPHQLGWEDADELPFEAIPGAGPLLLGGFDGGEVGLDVDGLGRARALIYARGRQRYGYSDDTEGMAPEEWLLQVFPDPDAQDALAGDPRRLAGQAPHGPPSRTGWSAAIHAWVQSGWNTHLLSVGAFNGVHLALWDARRPISRRELALEAMPFQLRQSYDQSTPKPDPLSVPLPSGMTFTQDSVLGLGERAKAGVLADLAGRAGLSEITVMGDFIQALENIGLLLVMRRDGQELLVPNPCPGMVWDVLDIPESERHSIRLQIGYADFRSIADDLNNIVAWAADLTLTTTPRTLATRLAVTVGEVRGGLDLLALEQRVTHRRLQEEGNDDLDVADVVLVIQATRRRDTRS